MSDSKKYYYLKLKDNFFDSDEMIILESMVDGHLYTNILLKLYLRSLKNEGKLMFNDKIPFNSTMLAQVTRHNVGVIEKAMQIFQELNLIEVLESGAIYMADIQSFIGKSSTEADRKRDYRKRIELEKKGRLIEGQITDKCPDKTPPEKEIDIDIEKEKEKEKEKEESQQSSDDIIEPDDPSIEFNESSVEIQLCRFMISEMLKVKPDARVPSSVKNLQKWAKHVDYLIRIDERDPRAIAELFRWCQQDDFWCANIRSPQKLREKWDTLELQSNKNKAKSGNNNQAQLEEMYRKALEEEANEENGSY